MIIKLISLLKNGCYLCYFCPVNAKNVKISF